MAITTIFKERTETMGVGKNKATFLEVLIGGYGYTSTDMDEDSGIPITKEWTTGATIDEPYGLQLVTQELCVDRRGVGGGTNVYIGGIVMVNDPDAEAGEGILREDNYAVKNILSIFGATSNYDDSPVNGAPIYIREDYHDRPIQRLFTAPVLPLECVHYVYGMNVNDLVDVTAKFTFKKVKMTKNAWLEKLAIRSYN
jgi:hypothetical protein